jgi:crossover junction endodeoxyribonuclease RuvC
MSKVLRPITFMGIDPGYDRLGWAIGQWDGKNWSQLDFGCIITDPKAAIFDRYQQIQTDLIELLKEFSPQQAGIESVFFSKNQTTAMRVSEVRGLIINNLLNQNCQIMEFTPNQIKQAVTGAGNADKTAVAKMVRLELQLDQQVIIDDAMDALAILLTCQATHDSPLNRSTSTPL